LSSGEVVDEGILRQFDPVTNFVVVNGKPSHYVGTADAIPADVAGAGFDIDTIHVEAPKTVAEQAISIFALRSPTVRPIPTV
jgi:hypothetical protein